MLGTRHLIRLILVGLLISSCGQDRKIERFQSDPNTVVSIDHSVEVRPGMYAGSTVDAVTPYAAKSVNMEAKVSVGADGYLLTLKWSFEGRKPEYWEIEAYADQDDGRDDDSHFQGKGIVKDGDPLEYVSLPMGKNRTYKFLLIGKISIYDPGKTIDGSVVYKTVHVNLKGLP